MLDYIDSHKANDAEFCVNQVGWQNLKNMKIQKLKNSNTAKAEQHSFHIVDSTPLPLYVASATVLVLLRLMYISQSDYPTHFLLSGTEIWESLPILTITLFLSLAFWNRQLPRTKPLLATPAGRKRMALSRVFWVETVLLDYMFHPRLAVYSALLVSFYLVKSCLEPYTGTYIALWLSSVAGIVFFLVARCMILSTHTFAWNNCVRGTLRLCSFIVVCWSSSVLVSSCVYSPFDILASVTLGGELDGLGFGLTFTAFLASFIVLNVVATTEFALLQSTWSSDLCFRLRRCWDLSMPMPFRVRLIYAVVQRPQIVSSAIVSDWEIAVICAQERGESWAFDPEAIRFGLSALDIQWNEETMVRRPDLWAGIARSASYIIFAAVSSLFLGCISVSVLSVGDSQSGEYLLLDDYQAESGGESFTVTESNDGTRMEMRRLLAESPGKPIKTLHKSDLPRSDLPKFSRQTFLSHLLDHNVSQVVQSLDRHGRAIREAISDPDDSEFREKAAVGHAKLVKAHPVYRMLVGGSRGTVTNLSSEIPLSNRVLVDDDMMSVFPSTKFHHSGDRIIVGSKLWLSLAGSSSKFSNMSFNLAEFKRMNQQAYIWQQVDQMTGPSCQAETRLILTDDPDGILRDLMIVVHALESAGEDASVADVLEELHYQLPPGFDASSLESMSHDEVDRLGLKPSSKTRSANPELQKRGSANHYANEFRNLLLTKRIVILREQSGSGYDGDMLIQVMSDKTGTLQLKDLDNKSGIVRETAAAEKILRESRPRVSSEPGLLLDGTKSAPGFVKVKMMGKKAIEWDKSIEKLPVIHNKLIVPPKS
jgi:hypothetical protein